MGAESLFSSETYVSSSFSRIRWRIHRVGVSGFFAESTMVKSRYSRLRLHNHNRPLLAVLILIMMDLGTQLIINTGRGNNKVYFLARQNLEFMGSSSSSEVKASESCDELRERGKQWGVEVLSSSKPRVLLYHNFLSKEECEHLIALGAPHMKRSMVLDTQTGGSKYSSSRTSTGMFLDRGQDKVVRAIERRIAEISSIPVENGEGIQVLRYEVGQETAPHFDYFPEKFLKNGGQRIATLVMYLSDVEEGGETVFPHARRDIDLDSVPWWKKPLECGSECIVVKPKMGNALLFWNMLPDGTAVDPTSFHGGRPVIKGEKWAATKWMHVGRY